MGAQKVVTLGQSHLQPVGALCSHEGAAHHDCVRNDLQDPAIQVHECGWGSCCFGIIRIICVIRFFL